ncbi:MAG: hypothetical protein HYZ37_02805 [Candidatus Solibacter usitatus]|nr:hypothetical protein [Candidatus Solibacter usitatus]
MNNNTKSSITLPPAELKLVIELQKTLKAKSKVEVIRMGLAKLLESTSRDKLRTAFRDASHKVRKQMRRDLQELDGISDEGLD